MNIENVFLLKVDYNAEPRYLVVLQVCKKRDLFLKNDKLIPNYNLRVEGLLNPHGFGTLDQIKQFYGPVQRSLTYGHLPDGFNSEYSIIHPTKGMVHKADCFEVICERVYEQIEHPLMPLPLFGHIPLVDVAFSKEGRQMCFGHIPMETAIKKCDDYISETVSMAYINIISTLVTKKQRREMEKGYFVIKIDSNSNSRSSRYVEGYYKGDFSVNSGKRWARQFKTENEAFDYIKKHEKQFGEKGFEIEEVKGMTLEEGLDRTITATL